MFPPPTYDAAMRASRRVGSVPVRSVVAVGVAALLLAVAAACGSSDDASSDVESGGTSTTEAADGDGSTTTDGLPADFVTAALLSAGDELVGLAPRGAGDPTTTVPPDDGVVESLEIVAYRSADAESWSEEGLVSGLEFSADELISGGDGDGDTLLLVGASFAGGSSAGPGGRVPLALTSSDGLEWERVDEEQLIAVREMTAVTVDSDGSGFLAVGTGSDADEVATLVASDDGRSWREVDATGLEVEDGSEDVGALAASEGGYVAFGLTECDDCSDDAVAVGWTSPDGADWSIADLGPLGEALDEPNTDLLPTVVGTPAGIVAIVEAGSTDDPSTVWLSDDGTEWREGPALDVPDNADFLSAAALGDEVIALFAIDDKPEVRRISASG